MPGAPGAETRRWRVTSPFSVWETAHRLTTVIGLNADIRLIAAVEHAENVTALLFEDVHFVRRIVHFDPEAAFQLPIKALIWQERRTPTDLVWLRTTDPRALVSNDSDVPASVGEIEVILEQMIGRSIDPSDSLQFWGRSHVRIRRVRAVCRVS